MKDLQELLKSILEIKKAAERATRSQRVGVYNESGSITISTGPASDLARVDRPSVPDECVGHSAGNGMAEQRFGFEPAQPAVDEPREDRVARADRVDGRDLGGNCSIALASKQDRHGFATVRDDSDTHTMPVPVPE